jgi:hypothetical protein
MRRIGALHQLCETENAANTATYTLAMRASFRLAVLVVLILVTGMLLTTAAERAMRFAAQTPEQAVSWQREARLRLYRLMMGGGEPARCPLAPELVKRYEVPGEPYVLEELRLQTLPDRRGHVWVARPLNPAGKVGVVLAINGHGGSGEQVVRGSGLYWYGREFARMGCVVIAPDVGQHELQHTNWTLMGERTWDALRSIDYALTLPEVDPERLAVAGLSLGGETTMYVAALDERVKMACSSGWLTSVQNMLNGHCPCFNFPGLEENFDFSDIFSCIAPRQLVCELGEQERAPGGFPVAIGGRAFSEIQDAYRVFGAVSNAVLTVHPGPHVFSGQDFLPRLRAEFKATGGRLPNPGHAAAWIRFVDAPERLDGTPYHWLGRGDFGVEFSVKPMPGDALEVAWGGKGDEREALFSINGKSVVVRDGGHWGFRWLRVPVPAGLDGDHYELTFRRGQGQPAFLSEVRLTRAKAIEAMPDLSRPIGRAKGGLVSPTGSEPGEAFPEMRKAWDQPTSAPAVSKIPSEQFRAAEQNGRLANEALYRCRRYVDGWLAHTDPATGLFPRNLGDSRDFWNGRDSAADNYPFMVLTAALTDRSLLNGQLLQILKTETRLTSRVGRLPDDYSFSKHGWRREQVNLQEIIFDASEYVKDGLLPITEWLGPSPWSDRMTGILDDIWEQASIQTEFGKIPTENVEVCGDLLQACTRVYWFTGDRKYLDWATRLGDYFLLGTNHPTRDFKQLRLIDHGCEVVNGLTELYYTLARVRPEKKQSYETPLHEMLDCILNKGANADGLLYSWFDPRTGEHSRDLCDTWGYDYDGFYTIWLTDHTERYREAVRRVLGNLEGKYVGACWADTSADGFADSIEGALNLVNREPNESAGRWIDSQTRMMWAIQKPDGIIEAWHGDGNFARTSLMYALWKTQGTSIEPWRKDVRFGAVRTEKGLTLVLTADQPWKGKLIFDRPRHAEFMHLPEDYARINQFPEWFTVKRNVEYRVALNDATDETVSGEEMTKGVSIELKPGIPAIVQAFPVRN